MTKMNIYLNFGGNTEEAFNFYRSVFGGRFSFLQRFRDTPQAGKLPSADQEKIMHIELPVGNTTLMATDTLESMGHKLSQGNNFSIEIEAESKKKADSLFSSLSEGGKVEMPLQKTEWNAYFGMCTDRYGVQWMVNHALEQEKGRA